MAEQSELDLNQGYEFLAPLRGIADGVFQPIVDNNPLPPVLYHYTNAQGLLGIVGEDCLRFTDAQFLNDRSENQWGLYLLNQQLEAEKVGKSEKDETIIEGIRRFLVERSFQGRAAVFCLCGRDNLLNQWRDYGNDVVPYSLGFDTAKLIEPDAFSFHPALLKIIYDENQQKALVKELIDRTLSAVWRSLHNHTLNDNEMVMLQQFAAGELLRPNYWFKNPAFEAEEEWRLAQEIGFLVANNAVHWRAGKYGITSYFEFRPAGPDSKLPILSARVGPSHYSDITPPALTAFMRSEGHENVAILDSTIPVRN